MVSEDAMCARAGWSLTSGFEGLHLTLRTHWD